MTRAAVFNPPARAPTEEQHVYDEPKQEDADQAQQEGQKPAENGEQSGDAKPADAGEVGN